MIVKESLLKFENFAVLNSSCIYNHGENLSPEIVSSYPLDINLEILAHNKERKFKVVVSAKLNENNNPGYNINVVSATFFSIGNEASDSDIDILIKQSGVQMAIANLRAYIEVLTSYYSLGKYTIPTIDLNDLLNKIAEESTKKDNN